ncbi:hypothetical protein [Priestia megaterium]|uniref:hypothetical protein n=1 Tax=Priestia megaterium TaxID=1404 RepID=UPI000BFB5F90|nr:hypothetical protein [Priestia megaterium]PGQ88226.1 hypothetical protein COA18_04685 [Priestia megaterium]
MNEIIVDLEKARIVSRVMKEYEEVMETVLPYSLHLDSYVPNPFDLVNAFPNMSWEEAIVPITQVIYENHVFIKFDREYFFIPVTEVW